MTIPSALLLPGMRRPTATVYLDGKLWRAWLNLRVNHAHGDDYAQAMVTGRAPPVVPRSGMVIRWSWGYNGIEVAAINGEVTKILDQSYPDRYKLDVKDVLWRAARARQVMATSPLNDIPAQDAAVQLLTTYAGIPSSRISLPVLSASGSAWVGSAWVLGTQTPVAWGDSDTGSGGTSALAAVQQIYGALGYWVYATPAGNVNAKLMERKPSTSALRVFQRGDGITPGTLLLEGAPEREEDPSLVRNHVIVLGANTGVDGSQIHDDWRTNDTILPSDSDQDYTVSNFLIEYVNRSEAGAASASAIAERVLTVLSRQPDVARFRGKADPRILVGTTIGIKDANVRLGSTKNYFVYGYERELDRASGRFDDRYIADGGVGDSGFTTIPPPDADFTWTLDSETLDGDAVILVSLDGSASSSPTGEIVSYTWSTDATTYGSTPDTATGVTAQLLFPATPSPINITLVVVDTSSKNDSETRPIDLTGADTAPPILEVVSGAAGAAWYVTPDGGGAWRTESGDCIAVGTIGAGVDDRASGTGGTFGLLATKSAMGVERLRGSLDALAFPSTDLVTLPGPATSNIWVNEANPERVWVAVGATLYRSLDGGTTKTAMAAAPATIVWVMEDPSVDNSVFIACGADLLNATDPTVGWALLYAGPVGATARQFVRSRDGQVTWIAYTGAPVGEALQRVENGAAADFDATDCRTLALDRNASSLRATVYGITGDDPAQIWSFDGLTGLSAHQLTATFPAGATVQHMLASRQFDVFYCADFDSVAPGQGAFRKLFAAMDQLLLWKTLSPGENGHMLGLGSSGVAARATILLLPYGATGAADKLFILDASTGIYTSKDLPEASKTDWFSIRVNPFDTKKMLLLRRPAGGSGPGGTADNALWYTDDGADTWTNIWTNLPNGTNFEWRYMFAEWSLSFGDEWVSGHVDGSNYLIRGTNDTYADHAIQSTGQGASPGLASEAIYLTVDNHQWWVDPANTSHDAGLTALPFSKFITIRNTRQAVAVDAAVSGLLYVTNDYRAGVWNAISSTNTILSSAVLADGTIVAGNGASGTADVITDAWGAAQLTSVGFNAFGGSSDVIATSDAQTQSIAAVLAAGIMSSGSSAAYPLIRNPASGAWVTLPRPPDATDLAWAIEVVGVI